MAAPSALRRTCLLASALTQTAKPSRSDTTLLPFAFCLLPFAFHFVPSHVRARRPAIFAAALLPLLLAAGCGGGGGGGSTSPATGRALGVVRQRSDSRPVAGARVTFATRQATTDGEGRYVVDAIPVGTSQFRVEASGFATATGSLPSAIAAGDNAVADVLLSPTVSDAQPGLPFSVQGRVTLSGQADAGGVSIVALDTATPTPVDETQSAPDGRYTLWVPPGTYRLRASRQGFVAQERQVTVADVNQPITADFRLTP